MAKRIFYISLLAIAFSFAGLGAAQGDTIKLMNPLGNDVRSFPELIDKIIDFIFQIAVVLAPLMVVIGAVFILTAGVNPENVNKGRSIILYTAIGFGIVLLSKGIVYIMLSLF